MNGEERDEIGLRLRQALGDSGLTRPQFCAQLNIATSTLANYLSGKRLPDLPLAMRLARLFGINLYWLLFGEQPMYVRGAGSARPGVAGSEEVVQVPALGPRLAPGTDVADPESLLQNAGGRFCFSFAWLSSQGAVENMVLTYVAGDCMSPLLENGDMALVDLSRKEILGGKTYAFVLEDQIIVKKIDVGVGGYLISCENPSYRPIEVPAGRMGEIPILGRVVWIGRHLLP